MNRLNFVLFLLGLLPMGLGNDIGKSEPKAEQVQVITAVDASKEEPKIAQCADWPWCDGQ